MIKTLCFHYYGLGSIPSQGVKIPHGAAKKKKKKKSYREIELYKIMLLVHWKVLRIKFKADDYEICGTQIYLTKKYFSIMT